MRDYTFQNGTTVTKGAHVVAPVIGIHRDNSVYSNALKFDGFRFARMREQDLERQKYNMVSTSLEWLQFGTGQHAWYLPSFISEFISSPARHFAVNEVKIMLAFTLLNYDVRCKNGQRPSDLKFQQVNMPNTSATLQFRRRRM